MNASHLSTILRHLSPVLVSCSLLVSASASAQDATKGIVSPIEFQEKDTVSATKPGQAIVSPIEFQPKPVTSAPSQAIVSPIEFQEKGNASIKAATPAARPAAPSATQLSPTRSQPTLNTATSTQVTPSNTTVQRQSPEVLCGPLPMPGTNSAENDRWCGCFQEKAPTLPLPQECWN